MAPVAEPPKWQEQKAKVDRFVARFEDESYRLLARHAAMPLVLTPELVNYLRNEFLRSEDVPWEAEVDLLLSDLCSQVGYELYAMDTQVRAYLLEEIQDSAFWQQRMREVAQVLISYVNFLSRVKPEQRQQELEAQRLAAMVYLGDAACQQAAQEIAERLKQVSDAAETGERSERGIRAELARLSRITQELAPQLQQTPALVEYARLVQQALRNPGAVDPINLQQVYQVGDIALTVSPRVLAVGQEQVNELAEVAGFPPLKVLAFETGLLVEQDATFPPLQTQTVESVTLFFAEQTGEVLQQMAGGLKMGGRIDPLPSFSFEIATLERASDSKKWTIQRQWEDAQRYEELLGDDLVLHMVTIPPGNFMMGSPVDEAERTEREEPQHEVKIPGCFMGQYPITQAQWRFVASLPKITHSLKPDPSHFKGDNRPVETVSWLEVVEFCDRLSAHTGRAYRLPTEAEWEYACRARTTTPFHFGATISPELANYNGSYTYNDGPQGEDRNETTPIDYFEIANAFGLSDMHGNVWEWCQDHWHESYKGAPTDGSTWLTGNEGASRVLRGGAWGTGPWSCRSASRYGNTPDNRFDRVGFRVVCAAPGTL